MFMKSVESFVNIFQMLKSTLEKFVKIFMITECCFFKVYIYFQVKEQSSGWCITRKDIDNLDIGSNIGSKVTNITGCLFVSYI